MNNEYVNYKKIIDSELEAAVESSPFANSELYDAIRYAILAPGKRIRGVMTLIFCDRLGITADKAIPFAVALEMIHAYSLVHDDLPEMDNDDFRRGAPTCHKKFGPAFALLAGDAILNYSVEFLLSKREAYKPEAFLCALDVLYSAAGACGMLGGQAIDIIGETSQLDLNKLLELHIKKTGALLLAPIKIAEALSGTLRDDFENYSKKIGLAFQIKDDILDVEGNAELLGKETGKDVAENKSTFTSILGITQAKEYLDREIADAQKYAGDDPLLLWLADYIGSRQL